MELYLDRLPRAAEKAAGAAWKAVKAAARRTVWSVGTALREAAETAVTWVFAGGMKLGLWTLPTVKDKNGRVRATQRLCDLIMWTGIVVTSALMGLLIVKVLIWRGVL